VNARCWFHLRLAPVIVACSVWYRAGRHRHTRPSLLQPICWQRRHGASSDVSVGVVHSAGSIGGVTADVCLHAECSCYIDAKVAADTRDDPSSSFSSVSQKHEPRGEGGKSSLLLRWTQCPSDSSQPSLLASSGPAAGKHKRNVTTTTMVQSSSTTTPTLGHDGQEQQLVPLGTCLSRVKCCTLSKNAGLGQEGQGQGQGQASSSPPEDAVASQSAVDVSHRQSAHGGRAYEEGHTGASPRVCKRRVE
jgi:hypothetical protein